jgi:TRAP transporter 4TM/12TM fusion protein
MATGTLGILMKIGIISDEMTPPRKLAGIVRALFSVVAVAYSFFFLYISFAGPPPEQYFKGIFMLGVIVLSILLFKNRQKPVQDGFVWLDEIFAAVGLIMLCAMLAIWADWLLGAQTWYWRKYYNDGVLTIGIVGAVIGAAIYAFEAFVRRRGDGATLSDVLYIVGAVASIYWWGSNLQEIREFAGAPPPSEMVIFSVMLAAVSYEIARRIVGPIIPFLGFIFFLYSFEPIARSLPGVLNHGGDSFDRVMEFLMASTEGMLGLVVQVFATYIVIFVILGAFLEKTGLGGLIIDATYRLTGQRTGGPGLAAVVSSGFFGMISGSGVANVVTTGTFTIPLMKRVGYRPEFAGGVEAAASTGGAYMPPIMGAGAFLLAELTETPYSDIIKIALIPALLYYLSVGLIVYFRAVRFKLHGVPVEELPQWSNIIPRLHLLLPIPVMVYLLVWVGDSPFLSAAKTIVLIVMLKASDLLMAIPTSRSAALWKPFLVISILVGVLVYYFGMTVGAPFSWFVEDYVGINVIDAGFWTLFGFIVLKIAEIAVYGPDDGIIGAPDTPHLHGESVARPGDSGVLSLGRMFVELGKTIWISLEAGARNTLVVSCIAGVLGILLAAATQSNLPGRVSDLLVAASFGLLPLTIFWVIVAGYIVGMGLPIVASYVILAVFAVGALTNLGVDPLIAHMVCYWVAVVSAVTPPVALAAYAASAIAQSDPVKTGNQALKLASMILITPYIFTYAPAVLLKGSDWDIAITAAANVLGVVAWAKFLDGFGVGRPLPFERLFWLVAAVFILLPVDHFYDWVLGRSDDLRYESYAIGALIMLGVFLYQHVGRRPVPA